MTGGDGRTESSDDRRSPEGWPVELRGVTESVVTTLGPNDRWNVAALGLHPPESADEASDAPDTSGTPDAPDASGTPDAPVTAETWGNTRTRRNFHRQGGGYVQFTRDPVAFVDAALSVFEVEEPILDTADAWVEVGVEQVDATESGGTRVETWALRPREAGVERRTVPTVERGFGAVVEATVAASRLDVDAYDETELRERLDYFEAVGRNCGGDRVRAAFDRLRECVE